MRYKTLNGNTNVPNLNCKLDKRGVLILKQWLVWLNRFVKRNTNNLNISIKCEEDLLSLDLELLKDVKNSIKISKLITKYLNNQASYQELLTITNFIKSNNLIDYIILSSQEINESRKLLRSLEYLNPNEIKEKIDMMDTNFNELTFPELYALYEISMGSIRKKLDSDAKKARLDSLDAHLDIISEEQIYSKKFAKKDKVYR